MKICKLLCVIIFIIGCQRNEVILQAHDNKSDCHSCPGYLVVNKNNISDTIMTGSQKFKEITMSLNAIKII